MSSKVNLTVDDFDPIVAYSNYDEWTTPNPQDNPTWFNASQDVTGSQWHQGGHSRPRMARRQTLARPCLVPLKRMAHKHSYVPPDDCVRRPGFLQLYR